MPAKLSRRAMLEALGLGAAMLPLLSSEPARGAAAGGNPRRLITIAWGNGVVGETFYPPGDELVFGETIASLAPWKAKVLIPAGLDCAVLLDKDARYEGHFNYPCLLTGTYSEPGAAKPSGPSIDTVIGASIAAQVNLPAPVLNLGVKPGADTTSFRGTGQKNPQETDPFRLFDRLFSGRSLPAPQIDALRARRQSVLDFVKSELGAFSARVASEDRSKIEAHQQSVRELELRMQAVPSSPGCAAPNVGPKTTIDLPTKLRLMVDLMAAAIRCDVSRVITLDIYDDEGSDGSSFPWLGINDDYHKLAHAGVPGHPQKIAIDKWLYGNVASLVKQLDETAETGGTALDHSVVVVMNDMSDGTSHEVMGLPFLMVGSCGGYFKTGRVVRLGEWAARGGAYWTKDAKVPHNRLLATLCNAMGMNVAGFGAPAYAGTLPQLMS